MSKMLSVRSPVQKKKKVIKIDKIEVPQLEKGISPTFQNYPNISYSPRDHGWKDIYLGILSAHAQQY
jgi:hypothetical protein